MQALYARQRVLARKRFLWIGTPLFLCTLGTLIVTYVALLPRIGIATYTFGDGGYNRGVLPLQWDEQKENFTVEVPLQNTEHLETLDILPDDCLEELRINGERVFLDGIPFCDTNGRTFDMRGRWKSGENTVSVVIRDMGGKAGLHMKAPLSHLPFILILFGTVLCVLLYGIAAVYTFARNNRIAVLGYTIVCLSAIYLTYSASTPYTERAYDVDGHVEYVLHVAKEFTIPPAQGGWQFYQPPLYYFLAGSFVRLGEIIGFSAGEAVRHLPLLSLLVSILTLILTAYIAIEVFRDKARGVLQPLFMVLLVGVLPGIVFFSSRITNDTILLLTSFLSFALLLRWWHTGEQRTWYILMVTIGVAFLSKSNALPLLPIALFCLLSRPKMHWKEKGLLGLGGLGIVFALTGWLFLLRFYLERETFIVGNTLHDGLRVENTWEHLLSFHPYSIVEIPFNATWGDELHRQFFFEFLLKSFFFGEWSFGNLLLMPLLARAMLSISLACIPVFLFGLWRDLWHRFRQTFPIAVTLAAMFGAVFLYRFLSPYSPNQDFRFVPLLILPLAYYTVRGIDECPGGLRKIFYGVAGVLITLEILFLRLLIA